MATQIKNYEHVDPVCGMKISSNSTVSPYVIGSCTYYFCAKSCRDAFIGDPEKYLKDRAPKHKSWWTRYLERLSKANSGKPMSCH